MSIIANITVLLKDHVNADPSSSTTSTWVDSFFHKYAGKIANLGLPKERGFSECLNETKKLLDSILLKGTTSTAEDCKWAFIAAYITVVTTKQIALKHKELCDLMSLMQSNLNIKSDLKLQLKTSLYKYFEQNKQKYTLEQLNEYLWYANSSNPKLSILIEQRLAQVLQSSPPLIAPTRFERVKTACHMFAPFVGYYGIMLALCAVCGCVLILPTLLGASLVLSNAVSTVIAFLCAVSLYAVMELTVNAEVNLTTHIRKLDIYQGVHRDPNITNLIKAHAESKLIKAMISPDPKEFFNVANDGENFTIGEWNAAEQIARKIHLDISPEELEEMKKIIVKGLSNATQPKNGASSTASAADNRQYLNRSKGLVFSSNIDTPVVANYEGCNCNSCQPPVEHYGVPTNGLQ